MENLLDIRGLSVDFRTQRGRIKALRDVSIGVRRNRIVGIVGESGSGKSTILWSILGLLAENAEVTAGEIRFDDRDMLNLSRAEMLARRGEEISVVFQDPMTSQIPVLTYARQMRDILYRRRTSSEEKRTLAVQMMRKVGIPDPEGRVDQYPHQFSGGMRQRAGIAMALMTGPKLLLADEPTTALDVTMEAQIIHLLQELQRELEATVVVVSHNLGLIAELCDDVVVMYAGEVVETGEVLRHLPPRAAPVYPRPARMRSGPGGGKEPTSAGDPGRNPEPRPSAPGLRLRRPLPVRHAGLPRGGSARGPAGGRRLCPVPPSRRSAPRCDLAAPQRRADRRPGRVLGRKA